MDGKGWANDYAHVNRFFRTIKYNKLYLGPSKDRNMFTNVAMNSLLTTTTKDAIKHIISGAKYCSICYLKNYYHFL